MSGEEWDDEEEPDYYPAAPLPPHERTWRHPSELGAPMVATVPAPPAFGRLALVGAGVVGVALIAGLIQLLQPRSGTSVVSTQATQALGARASTSSSLRGDQAAASTLRGPAVGATRTTVGAVRSTVAATRQDPAPTNAVSTMMLLDAKRAAVPVGDGSRAVTTAGALDAHDLVAVELADGSAVVAVVVMVDRSSNVAVLELDEPTDGAAPALAPEAPSDGDVVYVGCDELEDGVVVETPDGLVVDLPAPADEGAPVLDADGALVGLASTDGDGVVHLVPVAEAIANADRAPETTEDSVVVLDVWLGVTFHGDDLLVDLVQDGAPADDAGIVPGDRLLLIGATAVNTVDDVWAALVGYDPGDVVTLVVDRLGGQVTVSVTLGARPS